LHPLLLRAHRPLGERLGKQLLLAGGLLALWRRRGEAQIGLLLQDDREQAADVLTSRRARAALDTQAPPLRGIEGDPRDEPAGSRLPLDARLVVVDTKLVEGLELEAPAAEEEALALGAEELAGLLEGQVREAVAHREREGRLGGHEAGR
jgi:hypothetical protein